MLSTLFPSETQHCEAEDWMWETPALPGEEVSIRKAVEKRKREFRAGRHCAHHALNSLLDDHSQDRIPIRVGTSRQPCWPKGTVGSISHSGTHCSAVVAKSSDIISIGHDIEQARSLESNVHRMICTENERRFMSYHAQSDIPLSTLIFSAKESIHKTYYPLNNHMLDFLDAEIEIDLKKGSFLAKIINPEKNTTNNIRTLKGTYSVDSNFIYTCIHLRASEQQ